MAKPKVVKDSNRFNTKKGSSNPDRPKPEVGSKMRDKATIKRLKMYRGGKPVRDNRGKIVAAAEFQKSVKSGEMAHVAPNRKWFGNTRVITQNALQTFQVEMGKVMKDPYKVVMKRSKLPLSLLDDRRKNARVHLLDTESFANTFGPKAHRKKPNIAAGDVAGLLALADASADSYTKEKDTDLIADLEPKLEVKDRIFSKGQSKRIWNELYKVIDSSDVVLQVLDARDPMGTRSPHIEEFMKNEKKHKHLIFILNKCDLVPTWVTKRWVAVLSSEYPTLAFHASVNNPFGKGALIQLLRQFGKLHQDKKNISVGFIGYPNVGKSSIINTLKKKKVCKTAPIPGETKVWQYITLMRRIYLIDCPGVVYPSGDSETEIVLKGVVRVENIKDPADHIAEVLRRVKPEYIARTYKVMNYESTEDFLELFCRKAGRLLKGGEPDVNTVAKMILQDFQRGRLPYFVPPPKSEESKPINILTNKPVLLENSAVGINIINAIKSTETGTDIYPINVNASKCYSESTANSTERQVLDEILNKLCENENSSPDDKIDEHKPMESVENAEASRNINLLAIKQSFTCLEIGPEFTDEDMRLEQVDHDINDDDGVNDIEGVENESNLDDHEISDSDSDDNDNDTINEMDVQWNDENSMFDQDRLKRKIDVVKAPRTDRKTKLGTTVDADEVMNTFINEEVNETADIVSESEDEDELEVGLIESLSAEERMFLGIVGEGDSGAVKDNEHITDSEDGISGDESENDDDSRQAENLEELIDPEKRSQFMIISSPDVLCVEAIVEETNEIPSIPSARPSKRKFNEKMHLSQDSNQKKHSSRKQVHFDDSGSEEDSRKTQKQPRMTTNKKKIGQRYYETVNVKNKNRNKKNRTKMESSNIHKSKHIKSSHQSQESTGAVKNNISKKKKKKKF